MLHVSIKYIFTPPNSESLTLTTVKESLFVYERETAN